MTKVKSKNNKLNLKIQKALKNVNLKFKIKKLKRK